MREGTAIILDSEPSVGHRHVTAPDNDAAAVGQAGSPRTRARMLARVWLLALAVAVAGTVVALAAPRHKHMPAHAGKGSQTQHHNHDSAPHKTASSRDGRRRTTDQSTSGVPLPIPRPAASAPAVEDLPPDLALTKQAIDLVRQRQLGEATVIAKQIGDPVGQKLVEWALLRRSETEAGFERYAAFISGNPDWPSLSRLRRHAEASLWQEPRDAATVHRFFNGEPTTGAGRLALARVLMLEGDRAGTERQVRAAWRSSELSAELEAVTLNTFPGVLTGADHTARMDRRIGAKDFGAALRAAKRLGEDQVAIVKACAAVEAGSTKSAALLDSVSGAARLDLGFTLCRIHWLLRHDRLEAATTLVLRSAGDDLQLQDTDEWWRGRRVLARRLLDFGEAETAYRVVREAAPPANPYYRAEFHFMAGWIALQFLRDPGLALEQFAHVDDGSADPIVEARAAYWRGRAAEAAGRVREMRAEYEAAARHHTAYYGQLARARLGLPDVALHRGPPEPAPDVARELLHALEILYAIGERELGLSFMNDLGEESNDVAALAALGESARQHNDAQAMLLVGKTALARGLIMDPYAFPDIGVPPYTPIGPQVDRCIIYSVVRTESAFDQRDLSPAKAVGLMQVTPEAGRDTAKRFGVTFDWKRLVSDPVYNTQMGAAELTALLKEYRGSYVMAFAGYNAGRGRVQQWVAEHGDPRDPNVDAVDWVERIPLAETRNYVQRVMENLQVYRARFGASIPTLEPNLYRPATIDSRMQPVSLE